MNGALFGKPCRLERRATACLTRTDRFIVPFGIGQFAICVVLMDLELSILCMQEDVLIVLFVISFLLIFFVFFFVPSFYLRYETFIQTYLQCCKFSKHTGAPICLKAFDVRHSYVEEQFRLENCLQYKKPAIFWTFLIPKACN